MILSVASVGYIYGALLHHKRIRFGRAQSKEVRAYRAMNLAEKRQKRQ